MFLINSKSCSIIIFQKLCLFLKNTYTYRFYITTVCYIGLLTFGYTHLKMIIGIIESSYFLGVSEIFDRYRNITPYSVCTISFQLSIFRLLFLGLSRSLFPWGANSRAALGGLFSFQCMICTSYCILWSLMKLVPRNRSYLIYYLLTFLGDPISILYLCMPKCAVTGKSKNTKQWMARGFVKIAI